MRSGTRDRKGGPVGGVGASPDSSCLKCCRVRRIEDGKKMVFGIRNVLQRFGYVNLLPVHRARVPVVKFVVPPQMVRHYGALRHASHLTPR